MSHTGRDAAQAPGAPSAAAILRAGGMRHIAIIMDGNRRWARKRGMPVLEGHYEGVEALRRTVLHANALGLEFLTVYAFSTENWRRPPAEVEGLMTLFGFALARLLPEMHADGVRVCFFGELSGLSEALQRQLQESTELTRDNPGLRFQVAINYGGRAEIVRACSALQREARASGEALPELTDADIIRHLYMPSSPDPDLILRTGGEQRLSNFLLWQAAYAEVMVSNTLWPDFSTDELDRVIVDLSGRIRRFGR
jgi:undecaprenyl diphosphate synthase